MADFEAQLIAGVKRSERFSEEHQCPREPAAGGGPKGE